MPTMSSIPISIPLRPSSRPWASLASAPADLQPVDIDLHVVQVPILLGRGVRLWDGLEALEADYAIEAVSTPSGVTHLTFTR